MMGIGILCLPIQAQTQTTIRPDIQSEWQAAINKAREDANLIGVGGAILYKDQLVAQAVDGKQTKGKKEGLTTDDLFHIGSISKSMTATLLARLVENGTMSWDISLEDTFPDIDIHPKWAGATLEHFLTHTAGTKANFPPSIQFVWPKNNESLRAARLLAVSNILTQAPESKPDEVFRYSNVGVTIAGVMAERITGKTWEHLMRTEVFEPLGMTSAGYGPPLPTASTSQPWGHISTFGFKLAMDPNENADNSPVMGPAGIIHMNMRDLLVFGNEHARGMRGESKFLKTATFKRLHTPKLNNYAYGLVVQEKSPWAKAPILWHNGSNTMWYALLVIAPNDQSVFVMVSNDGDVKKAEPILFKLPSNIAPLLFKKTEG